MDYHRCSNPLQDEKMCKTFDPFPYLCIEWLKHEGVGKNLCHRNSESAVLGFAFDSIQKDGGHRAFRESDLKAVIDKPHITQLYFTYLIFPECVKKNNSHRLRIQIDTAFPSFIAGQSFIIF